MRRVLIISPFFPPSTLAGVHRARHLVKHLPAAGWSPTVLCVDEAFHAERLDPDLAALVPQSASIEKVGAVPIALTRPFGLGEISLRAWWGLRRSTFRTLEAGKADIVLITGSPYYPMLFAPDIQRKYGVPVVLDFQDPWVSAHGASVPKWSKEGISHRLAVALEPRALRSAAYITSVSETQNQEMAARYSWLDPARMAAIQIGGDPDDFDALRARPLSNPEVRLDKDRINFSYVGTYLPRAEPLVRALFRALAELKRRAPALSNRVRLNFVGSSNQPNGHDFYRIAPIADEEGVGELVAEHPQRVPFLEALSLLANSDGILMIGSDEPHYTASKIYPGLMSQRPFLSLFHEASSAHEILSTAGGGVSFGFRSLEQLATMSPAIAEGLQRLCVDAASLGKARRDLIASYEARAIAARFGAIFDRLAQNG